MVNVEFDVVAMGDIRCLDHEGENELHVRLGSSAALLASELYRSPGQHVYVDAHWFMGHEVVVLQHGKLGVDFQVAVNDEPGPVQVLNPLRVDLSNSSCGTHLK